MTLRTLLATLILLATAAYSQTVHVTGNVTAPNGCVYSNGTGSARLVSGNGSGAQSWTINGTNPVTAIRPISGFDGSGNFAIDLTNTALIDQQNAVPMWQFNLCSDTTSIQNQVCFNVPPMLLTFDQSITSMISGVPPPVLNCGTGGGGGSGPSGPLGQPMFGLGAGVGIGAAPVVIQPSNFIGVDMCAKINAAIIANPNTVIDARAFSGQQFCASNPFLGATGDVVLLLGEVVVQTTVPWVTSSLFNAYIIGSGRGGLGTFPANHGTTIRAMPGFPATCAGLGAACPVVRLGDFSGGGNGSFGQRIENLAIDCNSQSGTIGLYSNDIQEQSGANHFLILDCPVNGVLMDGSFGAGKGAENYTLYDGEVYSFGATNTSTVQVKIIGTGIPRVASRLLENITVGSGQSSPIAAAGFQFTNGGLTTLIGLNSELNTIGYDFGPGSPVVGMNGTYLTCGNSTATCVWIHSGSNDITLHQINNGGGATTVKDDTALPAGNTITDGILDYSTGDNGNFRYTTSHFGGNSGVGNLMPILILNNTTSASSIISMTQPNDAPVVVSLSSGLTAAEGQNIVFNDRGAGKWTLQNTGSSGGAANTNAFQIFDSTPNVSRLFMANGTANNGFTALNSIATGSISLNTSANSGTGGLILGSGGVSPTNVFSVNGSGVMTPGSVTGTTQCLQANGSGVIAGTGTPCNSGSVTGTGLTLNKVVIGQNGSAVAVEPNITDTSGSLNMVNSTVNRLIATNGSHYGGADVAIVPSAGWGSTPTVSAGGVDQGFRFGIAAGGSGITANPTIVVTYKDGTWTNPPTEMCMRSDFNAPTPVTAPISWTNNATTVTMTFNGTPVSGTFYSIACITVGVAP